MRSTRVISVLFLPLFILSFALTANAEPPAVSGQFLLRFAPNTKQVKSRSVQAQLGVRLLRSNKLTGSNLVETTPGEQFDHALAKQLLAQGIVEYIEPNYIVSINDTVPNDPNFPQLWGLHNSGQTGGAADVDIDAPAAWDLTSGSSTVVVGVVDTGINYLHPDLKDNIWRNPAEIPGNGLDDDGNGVIDDVHGFDAVRDNGDPFDYNGHGTHVAGTISGRGNNGRGISGAAWNVKLLPLRFLDAAGFGTVQNAIEAIEYAVRLKQAGVNIKVLSNSWGGGGHSQALEDAIRAAHNVGILFVAAAGNSSSDNDYNPAYPANYAVPNVVSVAAIDHNGNLADFSNYGGSTVDLAAPGVNILSTHLGGGYATLSGTSMAAPHVSGVAALVASREPALAVTALRDRLISTVKLLPGLTGVTRAPGTVSAINALTDSRTPFPQPDEEPSYDNSPASFAPDPFGSKILTADDGYYELVLPFEVSFFNQTFRRLAVSSNGRLLPLAEGRTVPNQPDYSNSPGEGISVYHDDLYPSPYSAEGGVSLYSAADHVTLSWAAVHYAHRHNNDPAQEIRFQVKLFSDGRIEFHYLDTGAGDPALDYAASATVGLFAPQGVIGTDLLLSHNSGSAALFGSGRAQRFDSGAAAAQGDFDGDGKKDITVWRPTTGMWYILTSGSGYDYAQHRGYQHGLFGDYPKLGDFDRDGLPDLVVWRPANGVWYFRYSSTNYTTASAVQWGLSGDLPLVGDWDGDGFDDIAVYRPQSGTFYVLRSSAGFNRHAALLGDQQASMMVTLGGPGHDLVVGDFTGNGRDDFVTVWQPARFWALKDSTDVLQFSLPWGSPGDVPLGCDFNGDSVTERVVVHPNSAYFLEWYGIDKDSAVTSSSFGLYGDIPLCGDYEGDGKDDTAVFRWWTGQWFIRESSTGEMAQHSFGLPGDWPL